MMAKTDTEVRQPDATAGTDAISRSLFDSVNPDIAQRLVLSEHTIHRHLANILRKLNLSSRAAAAAWGVRTGLV